MRVPSVECFHSPAVDMSSSDLAPESFANQSGDPVAWHELARTLMVAAEPIKPRLFEKLAAELTQSA